jgi:two-component system, OmpR family, response regulator
MPTSNLLNGMSILYVDDSADERELFEVRFSLLGARVNSVGTIEAALDSLASTDVDLLVSDIRLEGQDGYDLIRRVRSLSPENGGLVPAIAVTALVRDSDREMALGSGFDRHIAKPYDADALVRAVTDLGELVEQLRDFRAVIGASSARARTLRDEISIRRATILRQRERHLNRVMFARARLARSVDVIRTAESFLRERDDLGPIDQLNVGNPVKVDEEAEVWFVTAHANNHRFLVEVTIDTDGGTSVREFGQS